MVLMADRSETAATNFNTIKISIASPQQILNWSHGEVTKPETINYRTLRPEKDGLFCERLFGPTKDWECFCGKYKRIRYKGVVCDRCGVEVTRAKVRRERMCHIRLAAPVAHIWFSKTTPSRIGLLLDLTPRNLERVLYFAQHIIISIDKNARETALDAEQIRYELAIETLRREMEERIAAVPVDHAIPENAAILVADGAVVEAGDALALINEEEHAIPENADILAADGEEVQPGDTLALALTSEEHAIPENAAILVADGVEVQPGGTLAQINMEEQPIPESAIILVDDGEEVQPGDALAQIHEEHPIPEHAAILVDDGEEVQAGDPLAQIPLDVPTQITASIAGRAELLGEGDERRIRVVNAITANIAGTVELPGEEHAIPEHAIILVDGGEEVQPGDALAQIPLDVPTQITANVAGRVELLGEGDERRIRVSETGERRIRVVNAITAGLAGRVELPGEEHAIPEHAAILVDDGEEVQPGDALALAPITEEHAIPEHAAILVDDGEEVQPGDALAQIPLDAPTQITATIAGKVELLGTGAERRIRVGGEATITAGIAGTVELLGEGAERRIWVGEGAGRVVRVSGEAARVTANLAGVVELPGAGAEQRVRVVQTTAAAIDGRVELLGEGAGRIVRVIGDAGTVLPLPDAPTLVDPVTGEILESVGAEREEQRKQALRDEYAQRVEEREAEYKATADELESLRPLQLLSESRCRELRDKYPEVFEAGMGAESIQEILKAVDLEALRAQLQDEMLKTSGQRLKKAIKRLRIVESFRNSGNRVQDMILEVMPVLPPELRPMVQLDGGRFATSDLNDLYRRVINRNNRLKRLLNLGAPEIIIRNEKRMLQEAVDALIDNGRRGRPIQGSHNHKLKSLSDLLRGKQGRFRQNLLGKRVDYSGRSVIVVGPDLKLHECGLPREMALELFKPFVMHRLVILGIAPNIRNAKRMVERARGEVWDILEDVIKDRPVLLNRAPTLHRLGIQAFMPKLIDGKAIQIHPLVCAAFNADFDGDQMAVHVPLSKMAALEAKEMMLSTNNMLSPAHGKPMVSPTLDMVMGCYYLTERDEHGKGAGSRFNNLFEARIAHESGLIDLHAPIKVRDFAVTDAAIGDTSTTLGRLIFNDILPVGIAPRNTQMRRRELDDLSAELYDRLTSEETAAVLDSVKDLGFRYATSSGTTIAINDIKVPAEKPALLARAQSEIQQYEVQHDMGLIASDEKDEKTIETWRRVSYDLDVLIRGALQGKDYGGLATMANSGTKGNPTQINQMAGMRGLMQVNRQRGDIDIMPNPVKSSFREGLSPLEYFLSSHGARKGLTDTALNTASSGYMTRRLIDVAQEIIIQGEDCGTTDAWVPPAPDPDSGSKLQDRVRGRLAAADLANPQTGEIIVSRNERITEAIAEQLVNEGVTRIPVRSPLTCESPRNVCRSCYGDLPATREPVKEGQAVGIIAAQSIGERGTQLTMRTFHIGGVRGARTQREELLTRIATSLSEISGSMVENPVKFRREMPALTAALNSVQRVYDEAAALSGEFTDFPGKIRGLSSQSSTQALGLAAQQARNVGTLPTALTSLQQYSESSQELRDLPQAMDRLQLALDEFQESLNKSAQMREVQGYLNEPVLAWKMRQLQETAPEDTDNLWANLVGTRVAVAGRLLPALSELVNFNDQFETASHSVINELHLVLDLASRFNDEFQAMSDNAVSEIDRASGLAGRLINPLIDSLIALPIDRRDEGERVQLVPSNEINRLLAVGSRSSNPLRAVSIRKEDSSEQRIEEEQDSLRRQIQRDLNSLRRQIQRAFRAPVERVRDSLQTALGQLRTLETDTRELQEQMGRVMDRQRRTQVLAGQQLPGEIAKASEEMPNAVRLVKEDAERSQGELREIITDAPQAYGQLREMCQRIVDDLETLRPAIDPNDARLPTAFQRAWAQMEQADEGDLESLLQAAIEVNAEISHLRNEEERFRTQLNQASDALREEVERSNLDITGTLPYVEHVFEARVPKDAAILSEIDGQVQIAEGEEWERVRVAHREEIHRDYPLPDNAVAIVGQGEEVEDGAVLAEILEFQREDFTWPENAAHALVLVYEGEVVDAGTVLAGIQEFPREDFILPENASVMVDDGEEAEPGMLLATAMSATDGIIEFAATTTGEVAIRDNTISVIGEPVVTDGIASTIAGRVAISSDTISVIGEPFVTDEITANLSGRVEIGDGVISVIGEDVETRDYLVPDGAQIRVFNGDTVIAGTPLTVGPQNPHDLLNIRGQDAVQSHLVELVQAVYRAQGDEIHDKHIELILRQMLRRVEVEEGGGTSLIPGDRIDKFLFQQLNEQAIAEGRPPASARPVLMGVTRASLQTDSFLSRASFQETTRVLTEAAVSGSQDYLQGLKENVIIGRLIPAQVEIPGMEELLRPQPALDLRGAAGWLSGDLDVPLNPLEDGEGRAEFAEAGELAAAARAFAREPEEEAEEEFPEDDDDDEVDPLAEAPALEAAEDDEAVMAEAPELVETMEQEPDDAALALAEEESSNDEAEA